MADPDIPHPAIAPRPPQNSADFHHPFSFADDSALFQRFTTAVRVCRSMVWEARRDVVNNMFFFSVSKESSVGGGYYNNIFLDKKKMLFLWWQKIQDAVFNASTWRANSANWNFWTFSTHIQYLKYTGKKEQKWIDDFCSSSILALPPPSRCDRPVCLR